MKKQLLILGALFLSASNIQSQTIVSTQPENKKVVLEDFTGINCVFCPNGHVVAEGIKSNNPNDFFIINIHAGGFANPQGAQPDFRTTFGNAILNQSAATGFPAGNVNRTVFPGLSQSAGGTAMGRQHWVNATNQTLAQPSYVNVAATATIDVNTREITVLAEVYYTGNSPVSTNKLNVALLQNNTLGPQVGGNMGDNYNHMHRLVHMISGMWGTDITTTTQGSFHAQTFTYMIPESYTNVPAILEDMEIVVFVAEGQQTIVSGNGAKPTYTGLPDNDASVNNIASISPQCDDSLSPSFTLQNRGEQDLTSVTISYTLNGGDSQEYTWTGNLATFEKTEVTLPAINYELQDSNVLVINLPNDDENSNNSGSVTFNKAVETGHSNITIKITLDRYGDETSWTLKNSAGQNVAQSPSYQQYGANGAYPQPDINLTLANDCYTFTILDTYGDGMCCAYGQGGYQIWANGALIPGMNGGSFGGSESKTFKVDNTLSINENEISNITLYPNPSNGLVNIVLQEDVLVKIFDVSGKVVYQNSLNMGATELNLNHLQSGMYIVNFSGNNTNASQKLILK